MLSTYKPKSIQVIGFDRFDYDFLKNIRRDLVISIPFIHAQEINYVVDANGNLISDGKYYREYNGLNQLVRLGNTSTSPVLEEYRWHPIEERIVTKRIFSNGIYNYTIHYPNENIVVIINSSGTFYEKYVYQDGVLVAQVNSDGQKQAIHSDHEGSNTLITDSFGAVVENTFYSPYGEIIEGGKSSRFGYEVKEFDTQVEDYDFLFRKYKPDIPIFNQPDTLIPNVYDPQSLNRYMFERANPYRYTDPTGHILPLLFWFGIAFILAAGYSGYILASQLTTIEKAEGSLSNSDVTMAFLNIALIVFPIKSFSQTPVQSISQFGLKSSGKFAYAGYFDKRIANLEKEHEPEKPEVEEDLKCKIINCDFKYEVSGGDNEGNGQSDSPSTSNPSSQADSSKAISQTAQQNVNQGGSGYMQGIGYVTSGGATYPTNNPYFVPGTGNSAWGGSYSNVVQNPSTGNWEIAD